MAVSLNIAQVASAIYNLCFPLWDNQLLTNKIVAPGKHASQNFRE